MPKPSPTRIQTSKQGGLGNRNRKEEKRKLRRQEKAAAIRAKYGPIRKPSPVVIKNLDSGEIIAVKDQDRFRSKRFAPSLERAAQDLGFASYTSFLGSAGWRNLRELVLSRDGYRCTRCKRKSKLVVHHENYIDLMDINRLRTLCTRCHNRTHKER